MELVDPPPVRFFHLEMKATACPWPEDVWFPQGHFEIFHDMYVMWVWNLGAVLLGLSPKMYEGYTKRWIFQNDPV